jgi:hypothetical protein
MIDWFPCGLRRSVRAGRKGLMAVPNPIDRGKSGSKIRILSDRAGSVMGGQP